VKLQFKKRRFLPAALAILVLVVGSGVAYAFWTAGGNGKGTADAGTVSSLTVTSDPIAGLYPGQDPQPIGGTLTNPNSSPVFVTSVSATIDTVDQGPLYTNSKPDCATTDFEVTGTATVGLEVPGKVLLLDGTLGWGHAGSPTVDLMTIQLVDTAANQDNCKGATVHLLFTVV
jgi:hypothetical protein